MIFYFSGNIPIYKKVGEPDKDMEFFLERDNTFDRLICLIYEKESDIVLGNIKYMESKHAQSVQKRTARGSGSRK